MDLKKELARLKADGLYRKLHPVEGRQGPVISYRGRAVINLASNNYLGLAEHPLVTEAVIRAVREYGFGAGAARLISGNHTIFRELEERLAAFKGTESALLFGSGYQANLGVLAALGKEGVIVGDRLNHASLIDGARLAAASLKVFPHKDTAAVEKLLAHHGAPALVATDGVFSMDGDVAPLAELSRICAAHGACLMVDDAHATGVLGEGRGSVHQAGLASRDVPVQMGTLGKALGGYGAFVAGSADLIKYLINHARSFIYTTALPPAVAAGAIAALEIVQSDEGRELRARLEQNRAYLLTGLKALGCHVPDDDGPPTPIIPLMVGDAGPATDLSHALLEAGVLAPAVRPPTVPKGTSRLRLTVMATHTTEHLERVVTAVGVCRDGG